jgi:RNA 3'-phosphate cyclase
MIQLDGSHGEGGGSILRQALALSILTGKEFTVKNIRSNRENPGLAAQHLASLNAAADLCNATFWGNSIGSTEVYFKPCQFKGGVVKVDVGTAGSATLLLQSLMLPSVFSKKKTIFNITGGTDVSWSSPFDYFRNVFVPQLRRYADVEASISKRGYYPKGGGELKVIVNSRFLKDDFLPSIILKDQKKLLQVRGVSHASVDLESAQVCERQASGAKLRLKDLNVPVTISHEYSNSLSTGSGVALWAVFGEDDFDFENPLILGSDSLGARGKKAEEVGIEAAAMLLNFIDSGACVDHNLCDQLIPFLGVAGGVLKTDRVTDHVLSNIYVTELFLDVKFEVNDNVITCHNLLDE